MKFPFVTTAHWVFTSKGILRYLTDWGQRTVAVSDDIKAYLIREYGIPAEHISITINGIDTEKFSPEVSGARVLAEERFYAHIDKSGLRLATKVSMVTSDLLGMVKMVHLKL